MRIEGVLIVSGFWKIVLMGLLFIVLLYLSDNEVFSLLEINLGFKFKVFLFKLLDVHVVLLFDRSFFK